MALEWLSNGSLGLLNPVFKRPVLYTIPNRESMARERDLSVQLPSRCSSLLMPRPQPTLPRILLAPPQACNSLAQLSTHHTPHIPLKLTREQKNSRVRLDLTSRQVPPLLVRRPEPVLQQAAALGRLVVRVEV